jgi:hypothetical protein
MVFEKIVTIKTFEIILPRMDYKIAPLYDGFT